jgi:hypothetical protein
MKSKFLKFAIVASAVAFVNCSDDSSASPNFDTSHMNDPILSSSSSLEVSSSETITPASSESVMSSSSVAAPASSSSEALELASSSSEKQIESSSSETVKPASSSSEKKVESSSSEAPKGIFLASGKEEEKDLLQVEYKERTGWDGAGILSYPKQLSSTQKHGVIVWGPGGGTEPGAYGGMIKRLASHGFVVIALKESPGDASQAIKALDWLEKKNKDPNDLFYQKLELTKVGCSGHSMGGLESEQAAIKDKRVFTAFLNNSGDKNGGVIKNFPEGKTAAVLYGEVGMEKPNAIKDYETATNVKSCLIEMTGGPRNNSEGGYGHGSGSWDGMAATVAWMRWQIGGEEFRKADFVGTTGKYIDGNIIGHQGKWNTKCKNF